MKLLDYLCCWLPTINCRLQLIDAASVAGSPSIDCRNLCCWLSLYWLPLPLLLALPLLIGAASIAGSPSIDCCWRCCWLSLY